MPHEDDKKHGDYRQKAEPLSLYSLSVLAITIGFYMITGGDNTKQATLFSKLSMIYHMEADTERSCDALQSALALAPYNARNWDKLADLMLTKERAAAGNGEEARLIDDARLIARKLGHKEPATLWRGYGGER